MRQRAVVLLIATFLMALPRPAAAEAMPFVRRAGTHFMAGDQRLYFLGTSCYYLAYWASDTTTNSATGRTYRQDADAFLVRCRDRGLNVVCIWAFNDGADARALQPSPGVHAESALLGYDYVLHRGRQLGLRFVLCLVNNWDDYGGMRWYATNNAPAAVHSDFYTNAQCRAWYLKHVTTLVNRTNTFNGTVYRDEPAIFAWQLANEPRWYSSPHDANPVDSSGETIRRWIWDMAAAVKSIDTNHMVSTGEEGWTEAQSWEGTIWKTNNASPSIDYTVIHCWPDRWTWMWGPEPALYSNAMAWVSDHLATAARLGKPMVLSEYGKTFPLDGASGRHAYYQGWFDVIHASAASNGPAAGLQFWMLEADGSTHADGFGITPTDTTTLALLSPQADAMNTLIAPNLTIRWVPASHRPALAWNPIVGRPNYQIWTSSNLVAWSMATSISSNRWSDGSGASPRYYRVRTSWTN